VLAASAVATLAFAVPWAGLHYDPGRSAFAFGAWGLLPQALFPSLIGLITFGTMSFMGANRSGVAGAFRARDALPLPARIALVIAGPYLLASAVGGAGLTSALSEQLVVLVAIALGFAMLAPAAATAPAREAA
jgi:hypothetical protein